MSHVRLQAITFYIVLTLSAIFSNELNGVTWDREPRARFRKEVNQNCLINGVNISSFILDLNGRRKCFSNSLLQNQFYFEIPLCGIAASGCSQIGPYALDVAHAYSFGVYDVSTWRVITYEGSSALQVSYNNQICPSDDKTALSIPVVIICDPTASSYKVTAFDVGQNGCSYLIKVATSDASICSLLNPRPPQPPTSANCKVKNIDLRNVLLNANSNTRKCFSGNLQGYEYFFEMPLCGVPSNSCSKLGNNVIDIGHTVASGIYANSTWKSLMYFGVPSLQVSFINGNSCPFNNYASLLSNEVVITCDSSLSTTTVTAMQTSDICSYRIVITTPDAQVCSLVTTEFSLPPSFSPSLRFTNETAVPSSTPVFQTLSPIYIPPVSGNIANGCNVLGHNLSSIILSADGVTRKCFTVNYLILGPTDIFMKANFELPLSCGVPAPHCSQLGHDQIDIGHTTSLGTYDASTWVYDMYLGSKPSLAVTFNGGVCPGDHTTRVNTNVRIYCDSAATSDKVFFTNGESALCVNNLYIATSKKALCGDQSKIIKPSSSPVLPPSAFTFNWNYNVKVNGYTDPASCTKYPVNCTLRAAWESCMTNTARNVLNINGTAVVNCRINIEPSRLGYLITSASALTDKSFHALNLTSSMSVVISVDIEGNDNILKGDQASPLLVLRGSKYVGIDLAISMNRLHIQDFAGTSTLVGGSAISLTGSPAPAVGASLTGGGVSLSLKNVKITDCTAVFNGGAVYLQNVNSVNIASSGFDQNKATNGAHGSGGAIFMSSCLNVIITDSYFTNNVGSDGGALYVFGGHVYMSGLILEGNNAVNGGALYITASVNPWLHQLVFRKNVCSRKGGGMIAQGVERMILSYTTCVDNFSGDYGGALAFTTCSDVTITNFVGENNFAYYQSGAIYMYSSFRMSIFSSVILNNNAGSDGGGLLCYLGSDLWLHDVSVIGNYAPGNGGGAALVDVEYVTVTNVYATGNSAQQYGGGIHIIGCSYPFISDVLVTHNTITQLGGGLWVYNSKRMQLHNSVFHSNEATTFIGGGVFILNTLFVSISNVTVFGNIAEVYGGGIALYNCQDIHILQINVHDNIVKNGKGGGVYIDSCPNVLVESSRIYRNILREVPQKPGDPKADFVTGGGLYVISAATVTLTGLAVYGNKAADCGGICGTKINKLYITNSSISYNTATNNGGGIWMFQVTSLLVTNISVSGNVAVQNGGGGYFLTLSDTFTIRNSMFRNNTALNGGAMYLDTMSPRTKSLILNSQIFRNIALASGGGIFVSSGISTSLTGVQIKSNKATSAGGGIFIDSQTLVTVSNLQISGNQARDGGGFYLALTNTLRASNSAFSQNVALVGRGGSIYSYSTNRLTLTNLWFENENSYTDGGAVFLNNKNTLSMIKCRFKACSSSRGQGGAICANDANNVAIQTTSFISNFAQQCGSVSVGQLSKLTLKLSSFHFSRVDKFGGDICLAGTNNSRLENVTSTNAFSKVGGGVFYLNNDMNSLVTNSFFSGSTAKYGSVMYVDGQSFTTKFQGNKFINSRAYAGGTVFLTNNVLNYQTLATAAATVVNVKSYTSSRSLSSAAANVADILKSNVFVNQTAAYGSIVSTTPSQLRYKNFTSTTSNAVAQTLRLAYDGKVHFPTFELIDSLGEIVVNASLFLNVSVVRDTSSGKGFCSPAVHNNGYLTGPIGFVFSGTSANISIPVIQAHCFPNRNMTVNVTVTMADLQQSLWTIYQLSFPSCTANQAIVNDACVDKTDSLNGLSVGTIGIIVGVSVGVFILFSLVLYYHVQKYRTKEYLDLNFKRNNFSITSSNFVVVRNGVKHFEFSRSDNETCSEISGDDGVILSTPCIEWSEIAPCGTIEQATVGEGAFGSVFLVSLNTKSADGNLLFEEKVVVKILTHSLQPAYDSTNYEKALRSTISEVKILLDAESKIMHKDSIIKVYGIACGTLPMELSQMLHVSDHMNATGIIMRYEGGGSLKSLLHPVSGVSLNLTVTEKLRLLTGIARGISELHAIGVVHGDIKPDNILLSTGVPMEVRLADFGLASLREDSSSQDSSLIETAHFRGTPIYSAPEMLTNVHLNGHQLAKPSRKTDMYAFAIVMWEVMTERKPFRDIHDNVTLCSRVHQGYRPPIADVPCEYPDKLRSLVSEMWDSDRKQRKSAVKCFQTLKYYHGLMCDVTYDVYLLTRSADEVVSNYVWHRLIQKGLNVECCNEMTVLGGVIKTKVVLACLTKDFQTDPGCIYEVKHARELNPRRRVIPLFLETDGDKWMDGDMYYYCQMRDQSTETFDLSHVVSDSSWQGEEGPNSLLLAKLNVEIDKLSEYIYENIRRL